MKIVSFFESIKIGGGVENVQATLSKGLVNCGYDFIHLVLQDKLPRNDFKGKIVSLNEEFIFGFGFKKIVSLFKLGYKVANYCKKEKVDVIVGQGDFFYMVISVSKILFGNKSKCIGVIHTTIGIRPAVIKKILIFLLKRLDKVILISKEEYDTFLNEYRFNKEKLEIIYNPIDYELIKSKLNEPLLKEYENLFDNGKFTFINIGRLTYQKNHKLLLNVFDNFFNNNPNSQLIILGDGDLKDNLLDYKNNLKSKDFIHFLGLQENIFPFLKRSDCFVLSSLFEGFGVVLIEAMASGLPIVSTNCPSGPGEILNINNSLSLPQITSNGIIVSNDNLEEMVNAFENIYNNKKLREDLILSNKNRFEIFILNNIVKEWEKTINNL